MSKFLIRFFQYDTKIKFYNIVDSQTPFPAVTICNLNPFDLTSNPKVGQCIKSILIDHLINPSICPGENKTAIESIQEALDVLKASVLSNQYWPVDDVASLGFSIETMLISCFFNGIKCSVNDFTQIYTHDYGNCYTFNGIYEAENNDKLLKTTNRIGPDSGLELELFMGFPGKQDYYSIKVKYKCWGIKYKN